MLRNILPKSRLWEYVKGTTKGDTIEFLSSFLNSAKDQILKLYNIVPRTGSDFIDEWYRFFGVLDVARLRQFFAARRFDGAAIRTLASSYGATSTTSRNDQPFRIGDAVGGNIGHNRYGYFVVITSDVPDVNRRDFERDIVKTASVYHVIRFVYQ